MASSGEKFCLKWNDFKLNITSSFIELQESSDFSDVTLVCEEDQEVKAHRLILSACSPFFNTVFKKNQHIHPLLYMRGVEAKNLRAIIDFIYQGETNILQEDLDDFLALAEELKLKGLAGSNTKVEETPTINKEINVIKHQKRNVNSKDFNISHDADLNEHDNIRRTKVEDKSEMAGKENFPLVSLNSSTSLDYQISSMMKKDDYSSAWTCTVCGKVSKKCNIEQHIEANHIEGGSHRCNICGKESRSRHALANHVYAQHKIKA
jgi:hypothetical protein